MLFCGAATLSFTFRYSFASQTWRWPNEDPNIASVLKAPKFHYDNSTQILGPLKAESSHDRPDHGKFGYLKFPAPGSFEDPAHLSASTQKTKLIIIVVV